MSNHPLISQYVKGIYNMHPPLPIYVNIWDMKELLTYFGNMGPNSELTFKQLYTKQQFYAPRSKQETGTFRNRYYKCDCPN